MSAIATSPSSLCSLHSSGACGSCPHLDAPYTAQLIGKQERVARLLAAHVPRGAWAAPRASAPTGFRNKAKMVVAGTTERPTLGILDARGTGIDLTDCPLHVPPIRAALPVLADLVRDRRIAPYDVPTRQGELKHILVTASPDEDLMVRFVLRSRHHVEDLRAALPRLREALPQLAVLSANIQGVHQAIIEGDEEIVLSQEDRLLMRLPLPGGRGDDSAIHDNGAAELPLLLPTRSFFQTNTAVAAALYATARHWAQETSPGTVWDLFCGVGGFALALAAPGRRVLGVEVSAPAIAGARRAAALMGLGPQEVDFEAGDARVLDPGAQGPDLLVVNPPRRGIGAELAGRVEASRTRGVLYSSCNPATLAADLERMPSLGVTRARLFDMFPHTDHAEVLVELARR